MYSIQYELLITEVDFLFVTGLRCFRCGATYEMTPTAYTCPACAGTPENDGILDVQYDYHALSNVFQDAVKNSGRTDVFRFLPLLPVSEPANVLPVGGTPLLPAPRLAHRLGLKSLLLKDETRNPTRCLKDRATAVAVTLATASGYRDMYCASAGNAAISLAGFCAQHGLGCHVFVPSEVSQTRLNWLRRYGADIHVSTGNYDQAYDEAERAGAKNGWYSRNCAFNPFLVEGKKTVALEIGEHLGWQIPDLVVAPVGDGCTLGAIGKGFRELEAIGLTEGIPQLIGVQAEAIQPLVRRHRGDGSAGDNGMTQAASIAVRQPRNTLRLLSEIRHSNGQMIAVSDEQISSAQKMLAEEAGVISEFTSSATLAGLIQLAEHESLENKSAVLVITGGRLDSDF